MVLYVASDAPLPLVPDMPGAPLAVRPLEGAEERVRIQLGQPHVYFVGSHTGCSCGFSYGWTTGEEDDASRASVGEFGRYLAAAIERGRVLELYACWDGDEGEHAASRTTESPEFFRSDAAEFDLPERWHATVERAG